MAYDETIEMTEDTTEDRVQSEWLTADRQYKSNLFIMIFSDPKKLLTLYNALNGTNYTDSNALEIVTLKNAIYMGIKNDVSFVLNLILSLYEHQSTWNPNMPLRFLEYVASQYSGMIVRDKIYGSTRLQIPAPRFVVFYNGREQQPDRQILRLSDMYDPKDEHPALELEALVLNINKGHNEELMNACGALSDYAEYVARVRKYMDEEKFDLKEAVERAVTECIDEGILADFLQKNRAEVVKVSLYEFDMENFLRIEKENNIEKGIEQGRLEMILKLVNNICATQHVSVENAMDIMGLSEEERELYRKNQEVSA